MTDPIETPDAFCKRLYSLDRLHGAWQRAIEADRRAVRAAAIEECARVCDEAARVLRGGVAYATDADDRRELEVQASAAEDIAEQLRALSTRGED